MGLFTKYTYLLIFPDGFIFPSGRWKWLP
uniref:Uncharacterized protein n=1 Tax=Arundo donax TaxID=35708 RepID=A0A0A9E3U6_ARUDO